MSTPSRPSLVRHWLALAEELVGRAAPRLDALNLFPVPDADTGTNMLATLTAARTAADACPAQDDVGAVLAHAGAAALDSARGNSGMLLAVGLAGMAEPLRGRERVDAFALAAAFGAADRAARQALSDPREGTILTVLSAAARSLARSSTQAPDTPAVAGDADPAVRLGPAVTVMLADCVQAVEETESLLAPLTRAHVVDAGAVGLLWVFEALRAVVTGTPVDEELATALHGYVEGAHAAEGEPAAAAEEPTEGAVEVMGTLALTPLAAAELRRRLTEVGDAVILAPVGTARDGQGRVPWRVHVHVPRAEDAIGPLRAAGDVEGLAVTDLAEPSHGDDAAPDGCHGR